MVKCPKPKTVKELRSFLGLIGYYKKFVQSYAQVNKPLNNLLKKKKYKWDPEANQIFDQLKIAMTSAPVLALPDFNKTFVLEVNACNTGVGAILMQGKRPIVFMSQTLSKRHQGISTYKTNLIALLQAVDKWKHYRHPQHFTIKTYYFSLKFL